jgi:hypothetical protein
MSDYYDESDYDIIESMLEDLDYDEARRRPRRSSSRRKQPRRLSARPASSPVTQTQVRGVQQDISSAKDAVDDVEQKVDLRTAKANADLRQMQQLFMISSILPRNVDLETKTLVVDPTAPGGLKDDPTATSAIKVVTNAKPKLEILPLAMMMMMGQNIGVPGRGSASGRNNMLAPLMLLMCQQPQGTSGTTSGTTTLDSTMILLLAMAGGGFGS